ncbi:MAG: hypothetical protein ACM3ML_15890 [Micromonosporaceae bacterium]
MLLRLVLAHALVADARAAAERVEAMWRGMPAWAWRQATAARAGRRLPWIEEASATQMPDLTDPAWVPPNRVCLLHA